jgi:hypothetical protein
MDTNTTSPAGAQDEDPAASWTSETLSMPIRRQLLDRELRKVIDAKRVHGNDGQHNQERHPGSHPQGQDRTDEHGS